MEIGRRQITYSVLYTSKRKICNLSSCLSGHKSYILASVLRFHIKDNLPKINLKAFYNISKPLLIKKILAAY